MKTKLLLLIVLVFLGATIYAQHSNNNSQRTRDTEPTENNENTSLFKILGNSAEIDVKNDIRDAVFLEIDFKELARINKERPSSLILDLPLSENSKATFYLNTAKVVSDDFSIITGDNEKVAYTPGLYYQGTVAGNTSSLAAWSLFEESIMTVFSWNNENYVLGVWNDKSNVLKTIYILYKDSDVLYDRQFECMADNLEKKSNESADPNNPELLFTNCVKVYFECDYQMYLDKGNSVTNVTNYVTGMFNVVQTLYTNESIGIEISQIYVWSTTDPYISNTTSTDLLNSFQAYRTTFNGNLAHFLTTRNLSAGGLAYLDVLCTPSYAYGMTNISNTYNVYPNYSWTVEAVTHELGHNFGSEHTHWCGWTGGAIDDCYATEGGCAPGPTPSNGGTIMSYCHLGGTGILLTNGFGTQPGNVIRANYNGASCLSACTPSDPVCASITVISACGSSNVQTYTGGGSGSWNTSTVNSCGFTAPGLEKIYSFIAPATGTYSIQVTGASGYVDYQWKINGCSSTGWTCIGNINAPGVFGAMAWTAGTTYYILLDDENSTTGTHTFYINCLPVTGPCANVTAIGSCGAGAAQTYTGGGSGTWNTSTADACGYTATGIEQIYSFVAPTTGIYSIQVTAASGWVDYQWQATSCASTGWTCIIDINAPGVYGAMSWTAGTTYYLLLDDDDGVTGTHTFYINCPAITGPCGSITAISGCGSGGSQTYTGGGSGTWNTSTNTSCGYLCPGVEKIYSFVAPTTGTYSIQVTAASGWVDYQWQATSCAATGWNCIADTNATGQIGSMSWTAGTTYYILLDDEDATVGTHTFYINCPGGGGTDPCTSITSISNCGSGYAQTYTGGGSGTWNTSTNNSCSLSSPGIEKIYSFVAPATGTYSIQVTAASGFVDYQWKASSCTSTGWTCIDNINASGQYGAMAWTSGTTYYILLDDENATVGTHTFYINCVTAPVNPCTSASSIGGCGAGNVQTYLGGGNGVWNTSTNSACGYATPGTEQVFSFIAPTTGTYSIQAIVANGKVNYQWKASSCTSAGWSCVSAISAAGQYGSLTWTAGITYYLLLDDEDVTTGTHTFYLNCPASPSGISENSELDGVNIYPNPSTGNFTISIENFVSEKMQITIYNVLGEAVYISKPEYVNGKYTKEITLGSVAKGMYMVKINGAEKLYHSKIIVE